MCNLETLPAGLLELAGSRIDATQRAVSSRKDIVVFGLVGLCWFGCGVAQTPVPDATEEAQTGAAGDQGAAGSSARPAPG